MQIGNGAETLFSGSRNHAGNQKMTTIEMNYGGVTYILKLSDMVEIYEVNQPIGTITFNTSSAAAESFPTQELARTTITMPAMSDYADKLTVGTPGEPKPTSKTENVYYKKGSWNYQCRTITTARTETETTGETFGVTYQVTGWEITGVQIKDGKEVSKRTVKCGQTVTLSYGVNYVATPILKEVGARTSLGSKTTVAWTEVVTATDFERKWSEPSGTQLGSADAVNNYVSSKLGTSSGSYEK